jgi:hypothetical protein
MTAMRWVAGAAFAAATFLAWRAYDGVAMQVAWEQLLVLCGH